MVRHYQSSTYAVLAFSQDLFQGGSKIYCYANFYSYAVFALFSDHILGCKLLEGEPPVEDSQSHITLLTKIAPSLEKEKKENTPA